MKPLGRRNITEQIVVGVAVYVLSELAAWGLHTVKTRIERERKAEKKRRKKD